MCGVLLCGCLLRTADPMADGMPADTADTPHRLMPRVAAAPPDVLRDLGRQDGRDYTAYTPTAADRRLVAACLDRLPPMYRFVLPFRLRGIYFVNNYVRNAAMFPVAGKGGAAGGYIVINPQVLGANLNDYLSAQEMRLFSPGDPHTEIVVTVSATEPALLYLLLRETTHLLIDTGTLRVARFGQGIWAAPTEPVPAYALTARDRLNYTGLTGKTALSQDEARKLYPALQATPFVSLFAMQSLRDDVAELVTFYHLTRKLGLDYTITLQHNFPQKEVWFTYQPMTAAPVTARCVGVESCYVEPVGL